MKINKIIPIATLSALSLIGCEEQKIESKDWNKHPEKRIVGFSPEVSKVFSYAEIPSDSIIAYPEEIKDALNTEEDAKKIAEVYKKGITPKVAKMYRAQNFDDLYACSVNNIGPNKDILVPDKIYKHKTDLYNLGLTPEKIADEVKLFDEEILNKLLYRTDRYGELAQYFKTGRTCSELIKYARINKEYGTRISLPDIMEYNEMNIPFELIEETAKTEWDKRIRDKLNSTLFK